MDGMGWDGSPGGRRYRAPTVLINLDCQINQGKYIFLKGSLVRQCPFSQWVTIFDHFMINQVKPFFKGSLGRRKYWRIIGEPAEEPEEQTKGLNQQSLGLPLFKNDIPVNKT